MIVLGIHGGTKFAHEESRAGFAMHDSAAVLVRDGEVLSAVEEERLNRIKHTNSFPLQAIRYCLDENKVRLEDVDFIASNMGKATLDTRAKLEFLDDPRHKDPPDAKHLLASLFERGFGVDVAEKIRFCGHHVAHAWSAYGAAGYDKSLVLVLDGDGDNKSGMVLLADGMSMTKLRVYDLGQSLGNFYIEMIKLLGYHRFDEYKVMGLAPYGNPDTYAPLFEKCYKLLPEGNFTLADPLMWLTYFDAAGVLSHARRKGEQFTKMHMDLAAGLQAALEKIIFHILRHYQKETKQHNLCLAGGVAHNCTMNGKVLYSGMFDNVYVQPAAHDAGGALGAAWHVMREHRPGLRPKKVEHIYWGPDIGEDREIECVLEGWGGLVEFRREPDICATTARLISEGAVVGWVQGRSEFGPRALGNRSIVADPRPPDNKSLINKMVKKREAYRPFAPSVLEERAGAYFDLTDSQTAFPFMIFVLNVREHVRELLGAITHVDGTARVQTVSRESNPKYWKLIREFEKITGVPILLNTSFNNNAEPIVDSINESVTCFLTTGLNYLAIGSYLASKKEVDIADDAYRALVPSLPAHRRLVRRTEPGADGVPQYVYEVQSAASPLFSQRDAPVSPDLFRMLQAADGRKSISRLFGETNVTDETRTRSIMRELIDLWEQRAVELRPLAQLPR
jgi:carbamoyltransferase